MGSHVDREKEQCIPKLQVTFGIYHIPCIYNLLPVGLTFIFGWHEGFLGSQPSLRLQSWVLTFPRCLCHWSHIASQWVPLHTYIVTVVGGTGCERIYKETEMQRVKFYFYFPKRERARCGDMDQPWGVGAVSFYCIKKSRGCSWVVTASSKSEGIGW